MPGSVYQFKNTGMQAETGEQFLRVAEGSIQLVLQLMNAPRYFSFSTAGTSVLLKTKET